jgi:hypothetical protein
VVINRIDHKSKNRCILILRKYNMLKLHNGSYITEKLMYKSDGWSPKRLPTISMAKAWKSPWDFLPTKATTTANGGQWNSSFVRPIQFRSPYPTPKRSRLILPTHLCLGLHGGLFPSGFPWSSLYLTLWSRELLERSLVVWTLDSFPAFYGTRRFITKLTRALHLSLSCARPIQSTSPHPTSTRSILILSNHLHLGLPSGSFPLVNNTIF